MFLAAKFSTDSTVKHEMGSNFLRIVVPVQVQMGLCIETSFADSLALFWLMLYFFTTFFSSASFFSLAADTAPFMNIPMLENVLGMSCGQVDSYLSSHRAEMLRTIRARYSPNNLIVR